MFTGLLKVAKTSKPQQLLTGLTQEPSNTGDNNNTLQQVEEGIRYVRPLVCNKLIRTHAIATIIKVLRYCNIVWSGVLGFT